jgi:hypothetical protein
VPQEQKESVQVRVEFDSGPLAGALKAGTMLSIQAR